MWSLFSYFLPLLSSFVIAQEQPNILIIVGDDYGWADIGYHDSQIATPNLDRLASEGVKLNQFYAHSICAPSRASLMTGRYPYHLGFQHDNPPKYGGSPAGLPLDEVTLGDKLHDLGYLNYAIGKWHLGYFEDDYRPIERGFDRYFGFYEGAFDYYTHGSPSGEKGLLDLHNQSASADQCAPQFFGLYSTFMFADAAVSAVKNYVLSGTKQPLFQYVAFHSVHQPLEVPREYTQPYANISDEQRRTYCGMVAVMDEAIGNITQAYINAGIWNNTLLLFISDNGGWVTYGGCNYPLRGGKTTMYEGGLRVNGFFRGNLINKPKRSTDALLHISDIFPTLLYVASGQNKSNNSPKPTDKPLDGYNVWDTISNDAPSPRTEILHNIDPLSYSDDINTSCSVIRVGDWKLIDGLHCIPGQDCGWYPPPQLEVGNLTSSRPFPNPLQGITLPPPTTDSSSSDALPRIINLELYNIAQDPYEQTNLADTYPDIVAQLREKIAQYQTTMINPLWPPYCCDPEPDAWQAAATANNGCVAPWH